MNIYPSILTDSLTEAQSQLDRLLELPQGQFGSGVVQFDIIDGYFVDNVTLTPIDLVDLNMEGLSSDLHLMVEEPMDFVYEAIELRESLPIRSIIAQLERMSSQQDFVKEVKANGWQVGLSLDLHTPVTEIEDQLWSELDMVQIMTIEAGFQGQEFEKIGWEKIEEARDKRSSLGLSFELIVDGGVEQSHLSKLARLGVDGVAVGSALWQASDLASALNNFHRQSQD